MQERDPKSLEYFYTQVRGQCKRTGFKCQSSNFISLNILLKFVYFLQCCNDVVQERFASELKYEMALKLAALHIYQYALSCNMTGKIHLKNIE